MDLALLLIVAKALLKKEGPTTVDPTFEQPTFDYTIPECSPDEKLTYIPGSNEFVCLPKGFN